MAGVRRGKTLPCEYVAQMAFAASALYFRPLTVWVGQVFHRTRYFLVERWPAAMGIKFVIRAVKLCFTPAADVDTIFVEIIVLS